MAQIFPMSNHNVGDHQFPTIQAKADQNVSPNEHIHTSYINDITLKKNDVDAYVNTTNAITQDHIEDLHSQFVDQVMREMTNKIEQMQQAIINQIALDHSMLSNNKATEGAPNPQSNGEHHHIQPRHDEGDTNTEAVRYDGGQWFALNTVITESTEPHAKVEDPFGE